MTLLTENLSFAILFATFFQIERKSKLLFYPVFSFIINLDQNNTSMKFNATHSLIRQLNRSAILDLIREEGPIARTTIANRLSISLPTVVRVVDELTKVDLVRVGGEIESGGGRPRTLIEFNTENSAVIGLDLGGTKMYGTIANLGGTIQREVYETWGENGAENALEKVFELTDNLLTTPLPQGQRIRGIGLGVPGVTFSDTGVVSWAPSLKWRNLQLKQIFEERYQVPVIVENDVNLAALGEYGFGVARGASSLVCMAIGTGIGAGIVIDRKVYRGFHSSAGEVGYLPPDISYLGRRYADFGALESLASGTGIASRGRELKGIDQEQAFKDLTAEEIFDAARGGQAWAKNVVEETVSYLSLVIAAISLLLDPEVIVLGGGVARSADVLIEPILENLEGVIPVVPHLVQSDLGYRATVLGAILMVLDETTQHVSIERLA